MNLKQIKDLPELPVRKTDSHKGTYGRILVIAGSPGMTGAAYLTAKAAMRSGSGLVTLACPVSLNPILEVKLTSAMTLPVPETPEQTFAANALEILLERSSLADAVAIGPGISQHPETTKLTHSLVSRIDKPLVIDADGLNNLAGKTELLKKRETFTVITPHPGEMARLIKAKIADIIIDREKLAADFASKNNVTVVLKGHNSIVTDGHRIFTNKTGNPGMATGGAGDVLTGIIACFLGRGYDSFQAAQLGVYLHGLAGDIAASELGQESLIATDILHFLPYAFFKLPGREPGKWPGFIIDRK